MRSTAVQYVVPLLVLAALTPLTAQERQQSATSDSAARHRFEACCVNQAALRIRTTHTAQRREWTIRGPQVQGMDLVGLYEGDSTRIPIMELTEVRIRQAAILRLGSGLVRSLLRV